MDKYTLILLNGVFNEVENSLGRCILCVEDDLVFKVEPLECEVGDSPSLKVVHDLLAGTIDNVRYLVSHNEFLVLKRCLRQK